MVKTIEATMAEATVEFAGRPSLIVVDASVLVEFLLGRRGTRGRDPRAFGGAR
jgi:hypothetical protein